MKKGKVKVLALSHKNGNKILDAGDEVTENDVNNFDALVKSGHIEELSKPEKKKVAELVAEIQKAETVEAVKELLGEDDRKGVKDAAEKRIEELSKPE